MQGHVKCVNESSNVILRREMFSVCVKCLNPLEQNGVMHNWYCPNCKSEVRQIFSLCFAVREVKGTIFPQCNNCETKYKCFTERGELNECEFQTCKQVILLNGMDSDEVWCNLHNRPCMESPDACPHRLGDDGEPIKQYSEDDWRKER